MNSIPPLIFQTWKSKTDIPADFVFWSGTLRTKHAHYRYQFWDDADNRRFMADRYAWFLPRYDAFPAEIFRVDAVRYFFLYEYGGIYADMDMHCLRPLDPLRAFGGVVLGRMGTDPDFPHSIPNAWMMSAPRQEFWLLAISLMLSADPTGRPEHVTGSVILKQAHDLYVSDYQGPVVQAHLQAIRAHLMPDQAPIPGPSHITLLPGYMIFPIDWSDLLHDRFVRRPFLRENKILDDSAAQQLFPKSHMVTFWRHTWETKDGDEPQI